MRPIPSLFLPGLVSAVRSLPASAQTSEGIDEANIEEISLESLLDVEVSTAAQDEQMARAAPAAVSVITAEGIARFSYRTFAEALASMCGFCIGRDGSRRS